MRPMSAMSVKRRVTALMMRFETMSATGTTAAAVAAALAISCTQSPTTPSGNATVTTPALLAPSNGAQIPNLKQPVTLTISNAFVTDSSAAVLYTFEVATDAAFASKVQTPTASSGNGQTSVVLNTLPPGLNYFWHARVTNGGTVGTFSATGTFTVGAAVALTTPNPVGPPGGATPSGWPTFTVTNSIRTGPVAQLTYRFDVSTTTTFASTVLSSAVSEGPNGQTSFTPPFSTPVPAGTLLYWRAAAVDAQDGITSAPSTAQSFTPQALTQQALLAAMMGQTLWPGAQPPGTNGQAVLGDGCDGSPNWGIATCFSPVGGVNFQAPTIEALRFFDLFDRGYDPQSAIVWLDTNGYPTAAQWYPPPEKAVLGLGFFYLAARGKVVGFGTIWDIVIGLG
jgi:hypothetical protein